MDYSHAAGSVVKEEGYHARCTHVCVNGITVQFGEPDPLPGEEGSGIVTYTELC